MNQITPDERRLTMEEVVALKKIESRNVLKGARISSLFIFGLSIFFYVTGMRLQPTVLRDFIISALFGAALNALVYYVYFICDKKREIR